MSTVSNLSKLPITKKYEITKNILTWSVPPIVIPALRFYQDPPDERKKLWVRDFTTYSIGAAIFLATELAANFFLKRSKLIRKENQRNFTSFLAGLIANQLYAGIGAVKLSKIISAKNPKKDNITFSKLG